MFIVCRFAPAGSPLAEAIDPTTAWTLDQAAAVAQINVLTNILHIVAKAEGKPPKPIRPPWEDDPDQTVTTAKGDDLTFEEADELAAKFRPKAA